MQSLSVGEESSTKTVPVHPDIPKCKELGHTAGLSGVNISMRLLMPMPVEAEYRPMTSVEGRIRRSAPLAYRSIAESKSGSDALVVVMQPPDLGDLYDLAGMPMLDGRPLPL